MMMFLSIFQGLGPYAWFIVGAVFLIAEALLPGFSLVWFGAAATLTGGALFLFDMGWQEQMVSFIIFAAATVYAGRLLAARHEGDGADRVNLGPEHMIGREMALTEAITDGFGRVRYGDSHWRVTGPDQPAGTRVRVVGVEAATLRVEPVRDRAAQTAADAGSAA